MADQLMVASDENLKQNPNLDLAQLAYSYEYHTSQGLTARATELQAEIMALVTEDSMTPYYQALCDKYSWPVDEALVTTMAAANEASVLAIDAKHEDALENQGDQEVMDCLFDKARHFSRIGDVDNAYIAYDVILTKEKTSTGKKIDATMEKSRLAFFSGDINRQKDLLAEAKKLIDFGGDWDRRNRLKVYEALYLISCRELRKAAELLRECIATFTCVELCSYNQFVQYTVATCIINLPRPSLKKNVVKNPQVISVLRENLPLKKLLGSIYECEYKEFFGAMLKILPTISSDMYLGPHAPFVIREYRVMAYAQFLEAYKSVTLSAMATSFGMSSALLDSELSRFIAAGRLNAKIDKVGDVVQTIRPDKKNIQYHEVIKKGDGLLNQIQKLARVIEM
jgi:26S proteasome regulatory subunit N7